MEEQAESATVLQRGKVTRGGMDRMSDYEHDDKVKKFSCAVACRHLSTQYVLERAR